MGLWCGLLSVAIAAPTFEPWVSHFDGVDVARGTDAEVPTLAVAIRVDVARIEGWEGTPAAPGDTDDTIEVLSEQTTGLLRAEDLQAAINANFFDPCCSYTSPEPTRLLGLSMDDGVVVSPPQDGFTPAFVVRTDGTVDLVDAGAGFDTAGLSVAVAGNTWLLRDGELVAPSTQREPRTAIGVSQDRNTVWWLVVDGRNVGVSEGATYVELAAWMETLGAHDAINLDGGGSSTMVLEDTDGEPTILNTPSFGGLERFVGNHLGVRAAPVADDTAADTDPDAACGTGPGQPPCDAPRCGCAQVTPTLGWLGLLPALWWTRRRRGR